MKHSAKLDYVHTFQETKYLFYHSMLCFSWNIIPSIALSITQRLLMHNKPWHHGWTSWRNAWCREFSPLTRAVAMYKKTYPSSLCYGFIFNLLVALCTIGFMCYFLYRFDSRLVSLERRLWDRQRNDGLTASRKPALFNEGTHNKRRHFEKKNANDLEDSYFQRGTPLRKIREENVSWLIVRSEVQTARFDSGHLQICRRDLLTTFNVSGLCWSN